MSTTISKTLLEKIEENKLLNKKILKLEKELRLLKQKRKRNNSYISNNCKHKWEYDNRFFCYDERAKVCSICNTLRS